MTVSPRHTWWGAGLLVALLFAWPFFAALLLLGGAHPPAGLLLRPTAADRLPPPRGLVEAVERWRSEILAAAVWRAGEDAWDGIDPVLVAAVIAAESAGDPYAISWAGAAGLMQLLPETARDLGVRDPFDPAQNVRGGARFLASLLQAAPGWVARWRDGGATPTPPAVLAVAAYNAGPGAVERFRGVPPYRETEGYVVAVARYYRAWVDVPAWSLDGLPEEARPVIAMQRDRLRSELAAPTPNAPRP